MNHIFKSVFNRQSGTCCVMSELGKSRKKISGVKGLALLLGLSSSASFATQYVVRPGEDFTISDAEYIASDESDQKYIIYNSSGNLTVGNDVTLELVSDNNVYQGIYIYKGSGSSTDSLTSIGNGFTVKNNYDGSTISNGIRVTNADSSTSQVVLNIGDDFSVLSDDMLASKSRGVVVEGRSDVSVGANATIFGTQYALISTGADNYLANVTFSENATFIGRVGGQYNASIDLGTGSKVIIDEDIMSREMISRGLIDLNGSNVSIVAKDLELKLNSTKSEDDEFNPSVFYLMNVAYGLGGEFSEFDDGISQKLVVEGATVQIGNGDANDDVVNKAELVNILLSNYKGVDSESEPKTSYVYLKDVIVNGDGGHALIVQNNDRGWDEASGSYKYVHSNNSAVVIFDNVDASSQTDGIYLDESQGSGNISVSLVNGTKVSGGMVNDSTGDVSLSVDDSEFVGDIVNNDTGNISVSVGDSGYVIGDVVNNSDTGAVDMTVNEGGSWVGDAIKNGDADLAVTVNEGGNWAGTGENIGLWVKQNSTYTAGDKSSSFTSIKMDNNSTLDFGTSASDTVFKTIHTSGNMEQTDGGIANVRMSTNLGLGKGDLLSVDGQMTGKYQVDVRNRGKAATKANGALRIIRTGAGMAAQSITSGSEVTLAGNQYRDSGMLRYHLVKDASGTGYWLVNGDGSEASYGGGDDDLAKSGQAFDELGDFDAFVAGEGFVAQKATSDLAHTLQGASAAQTVNLLDQSRNINKRMDNLRLSGIQKENVWMNYYHNDATVGADVMGNEFGTKSDMVYLGGDKTFAVSENADLSVGLFGGVGKASTDYKLNNSNGSSDIHTIGVYGMWLHDSGVFANSSAQAFHISTEDKAYDEQGELTSYKMSSAAVSVGLDVGKRFTMDNGAYIEPMLKVAHLHESGDRFSTEANSVSLIDVERGSVNAFQYGLGLNVGNTLVLDREDSYVQPYLNVSLVDQIISGGEIDSSGVQMKSNLEGYQFNATAGVNWQVNKTHRVFAELGGGVGETYDENFNVGIGYQASF